MNLSQEEWAARLSQDENAVIVDVRTPEEWCEGIIPGAILLDIYQPQEFMEGLQSLDKSKSYYVYCKAGGRSMNACAVMEESGFAQAYNLVGGFLQWKGEVVSIE